MSIVRTIARDAVIIIGGAYLALCLLVIAGAAIAERWGRHHDRRDHDDGRTAP